MMTKEKIMSSWCFQHTFSISTFSKMTGQEYNSIIKTFDLFSSVIKTYPGDITLSIRVTPFEKSK